MRINETVESRKALETNRKRRAEARQEAYNNAVKAQDNIRESIYAAVEKRKVKENAHRALIEGARDDALGTSLKAIYISALNPYSLTDNAIIYAESLVDEWIKENGGATKILSEHKNDTYLLNRLATIVEDAAQEEVKDVEEDADKKEDPSDKKDDKSEDKKEDSDDKKEEGKDSEDKSDDKESKDDADDSSSEDSDDDLDLDDDDSEDDEDDSEDDSPEEDDSDETDDSDDDLGSVGLDDDDDIDDDDFEEPDPDEDALEDDDVNDALGDPISDDEDDVSIDDGEEKGKLFDDLNKEPDIKKAVNIIQQRVADAEEDFIKNNAEDKKKINDLITKVSDNVKTVENINDKNDDESKVAEESARIYNRKIEAIREARPLTIFEKMTRQLAGGLLKDEVVKEQFIDENGKFDMGSVIEAAKVQYTFLETLNTLQLENFTEDKLNNILKEVGSNN